MCFLSFVYVRLFSRIAVFGYVLTVAYLALFVFALFTLLYVLLFVLLSLIAELCSLNVVFSALLT